MESTIGRVNEAVTPERCSLSVIDFSWLLDLIPNPSLNFTSLWGDKVSTRAIIWRVLPAFIARYPVTDLFLISISTESLPIMPDKLNTSLP
jgi:hypothetical protein